MRLSVIKRSILFVCACALGLGLGACSKTIEYNSNSGYDGSRDSASQLLVNTSKVDDLSAIDGDNEDWFYFTPPEKGFITVEKSGRKSYYTPCITQEAYLASQSRRFFETLCGGNLSVFANALCDSGLSKDEIAQLRTLLERGEL